MGKSIYKCELCDDETKKENFWHKHYVCNVCKLKYRNWKECRESLVMNGRIPRVYTEGRLDLLNFNKK